MSCKISKTRADELLKEISKEYRVFAPASDKAKRNVRFREISSVSEIVTDRQSDFSIKETYYPISQVMFYFRADKTEDEVIGDERGIMIIARPCDINGIRRLDKIFLENGQPDLYYARMREKVKLVLLECRESFENCFCVSMQSNKTDNFAAAIRIDNSGDNDDVFIQSKDAFFDELLKAEEAADFEPEFVSENKKVMNIPDITRENLKQISVMEYWNQYDEKCVACGGCNTVCGTCSCFDTSDIIYEEGKMDGERRRIWSSCMLKNFTETAGGARSRKTQGANMRFKVFHKFYDYKARFKEENMCVGCGRCDMRCPEGISFFDTVNDLNAEIERAGKSND